MNIKQLDSLHHCPNLTDLNLTGNELTKVEGLESCTSLRKLTLTSNSISVLGNLGTLVSLEHLFLNDNKVSDHQEILKLATLTNLKSLYFKNIDGTQKNPVCDHPSYRAVIIRHLPFISNLDGERMKRTESFGEVPPVESRDGPSFEIPPTEPWLKDFDWDDCFHDVDSFLKNSEEKFMATIQEAKTLNANLSVGTL